MTLQQLIDAHHAAQSEPIAERAVLTPKGYAVSLVVRLEQTLADLDRTDRASVLAMIRAHLDNVAATA